MLTKIISGGQTGADRAALDFAIEFNIPYGGWVAEGRKAEDGVLPEKYRLSEMPFVSYPKRTEMNVLDSDGTLILSHGKLTGGSLLTLRLAEQHGTPRLHVDLNYLKGLKPAQYVSAWISEYGIEVLNVAGPRASKDSAVYENTIDVFASLFHLGVFHEDVQGLPKMVKETVEALIAIIPLKDKVEMARKA